MIIDRILESAMSNLQGLTVEEIRIGLGYTAVRLDNGACGLAATIRDEISPCCTVIKEAGHLTRQPASSLAEWVLEPDILASAVGLATINAVLNLPLQAKLTDDLVAQLNICEHQVVGMVGCINPLIEPIKARCRHLYVFDRRAAVHDRVLPDWSADQLLPHCDVAVITGTALLNKTIDRLLGLCRGEVAIVGPTTPLSLVFRDFGVSFLFGCEVLDSNHLLKVISEGGGTRSFGKAVRRVTLELTKSRIG